ncbi:helix-turn-helix domain-containing protein [Nocardiopsis sp. NPDC006198]|uniref:helix-turn-helix domain-containing protein n=1 Tax=Nocardiopsis sp. NPDC006198 TaxID=3154472 RepID=UPI0033A24EF4
MSQNTTRPDTPGAAPGPGHVLDLYRGLPREATGAQVRPVYEAGGSVPELARATGRTTSTVHHEPRDAGTQMRPDRAAAPPASPSTAPSEPGLQESGTPLFRAPSVPAPAPPQEPDSTLFPVPPAPAEPSPLVPEPGEDAPQESTDGPKEELGEDPGSPPACRPPAPHTPSAPVTDTWRIDLYRGGRPHGPYDHDLTRTGVLTHLLTPLTPWLEEHQASGVWARIVPATAHPWDVASLPSGARHLGTGYLQVCSQALPPAEPAPPVESPRPAAAAPATTPLPPASLRGPRTRRSQLTTGAAAKLLGLSNEAFKTLAEKEGLVCTRTRGGHRRYDQAQVRALAADWFRPIEDYYRLHETAELFRVCPNTISRWVRGGLLPPHDHKVGHRKYWSREVIDGLLTDTEACEDEVR